MARTSLIVDTEAIKEHISTLVKDGFDKVLQHVTSVMTSAIAVYKQDTKVVEHGLSGVREQIMGTPTLPLHSNTTITDVNSSKRRHPPPNHRFQA